MKIIAQKYKDGTLTLLDVPVPAAKPGGITVRSTYSVISTGTELMMVAQSKMSLLGKAKARPDQVRKVLQSVSQHGVLATLEKVNNRLDSYTPIGYSLAGRIEEVAEDVSEFKQGQRVACGGNKYALHAEYNWVPVNLAVPIPDNVPDEEAAFATVGSIAMQGFRQSQAKLGETAVVIGLGLIGQLLVQILQAAGLRVFGIDIDDDKNRIAEKHGACACARPGTSAFSAFEQLLSDRTNGAGADHIYLVAGGDSNEPVELAAALARDRARITDIGKCRLDLPWNAYYDKELELVFSRSYGPGRYDPVYEEQGIDYPIGYIRWTEKRNMAACLDLIAAGKIHIRSLISGIHDFSDSVSVYERMHKRELGGLGVLFRYPESSEYKNRIQVSASVDLSATDRESSTIRVGVIGCGNYASSMLLPHLRKCQDVELVEVATTSGLSAANAQQKFGFQRVSSDAAGLISADDIDVVMVLTPHSSHAHFVCDALQSNKTVFVEKPLAINKGQLDQIISTIRESGNDRIMVGFNRRFSPYLLALKEAFGPVAGTQTLQFRINAGQIDSTTWYGDATNHGSRFVGEGGHFLDTVSWWIGSNPTSVYAVGTDDDGVSATITYPTGAVAVVTYMTSGDSRYPKELLEIMSQGKSAKMDNFRSAELWQQGRRKTIKATASDKGQKNELDAFLHAVRSNGPMPISIDSIIATTEATQAIEESISTGAPVRIGSFG